MPRQVSLYDELIVDNFAGGGGASTGIELATGRPVDIAINHDPAAIAMHKANHPYTRHYCESVWDVDPRKITKGRSVGLVWLSPDCKHFSKAKGGKPVEKEIRGLAWVAIRWAATVRPRVIMLENVEEFKTWGPVKDGQPIRSQAGQTFDSFVNALRRYGYSIEHRELRACDYGAPTIRKRLFLVARCDGQSIVWPEPTHGDPASEAVKSGKLKPWRTAAEIIEWSLPCPSIFATSEEIQKQYGVRAVRPLAENTLKRIARGMQKFVIDNPDPFIVRVNYSGSEHHYCDPINKPLSTITAKNDWGVVTPSLIQIGQQGFGGDGRQFDINAPLTTIVTKAEHCVVAPTLIQYHSEQSGKEVRGQKVDRPCHTEPLNTVMTSPGHFGEVRAFMVKYYGQGDGQDIDESLHTITAQDRFGLVTVHGEQYAIIDIGLRMLTPRELFNAQGFPPDYVIDTGLDGKPISKSAQVARCGNAVPPPFAEALVRANLSEMCVEQLEYLK